MTYKRIGDSNTRAFDKETLERQPRSMGTFEETMDPKTMLEDKASPEDGKTMLDAGDAEETERRRRALLRGESR